MNRKVGMLLVAALILSLLITVTCIPLVMATQYKPEVVKKPLLFKSSEKNIESICTDATSIPVKGPVILADGVVIDSATTNGQWIYLGYCDGSITSGESQYWAYDAPSGTTQTYTYLSWDNASNDLDLYTYDHNWNSVGYSYQVNTNWEAVQNTNAYKATWYFQVDGYSITGSQSYHVDVWAWVTTYDGQATNRDVQVWNYPAYKYSMKCDPDLNDPSKTHVTCTVTFVSDGVDANYVGAQTFDKTYTYYLIGSISNPTGGMWEGDSINDHPDFIWRPLSQQKLQDCPLDYNTVKQIINQEALYCEK